MNNEQHASRTDPGNGSGSNMTSYEDTYEQL